MTLTIELTWWLVPTIITVISLAWALFWPADDGGYLGGIVRLFMLIPALCLIALAWIIGAALK